MDWKAISSRLGAVSDSLTGSNHFSNIAAQEANNATANRQIDVGVQQNTENNQLKKILQQIQIAADLAAQDKGIGANKDLLNIRQLFDMDQLAKEHALKLQMQGTDIGARKELSALDNAAAKERTLAVPMFEEGLREKAGFYNALPESLGMQFGVPTNTTPAQLGVWGPAAINAATMQYPTKTKSFGNTYTAEQKAKEDAELINAIRDAADRKRGINPGIRPSSTAAPSPFTPGK